MKISAVGEGVEWKQALSSAAPYELNYALPWFIMGQIQKASRNFLSKQEGTVQFRPKNHLKLLSL
jgi:hypothetical protein